MKRRMGALVIGLAVLIGGGVVWAHCQIPCGIYDDEARFTLMQEHVNTIAKSMRQIESFAKEAKPNQNQLARWIDNKEVHADKLSEIVTHYFMTQRIKPASKRSKSYEKYVREVTLLHQMLVASMKAKQTTEPKHCTKLRKLIADFRESYLAKKAEAKAKTKARAK
jgi:nickel superoxide dismutase